MSIESDQDRLLKLATHWKTRRPYRFTSVGDVLGNYVRRNVKAPKRRSPVVDAWNKVVPPMFDEFCRIESFQNGILKVAVSDATYRFQMEMLKAELIESIEAEIKGRIRLRDIKFV
ncbi:MAG: DUF721 domain-containing protein [Sedimentisphaeraceae bacterium JB056]